ncbi:IS30 family transposase [Solirubrobacter ginsenosidimutans]|uniref:IS30 family transposase n=1 Tax=Solirubrobacter ginsenosidimutans TaxID=490573 RepID=A0A9X3S586_9ACTN|nr:IS30 family transposase [Solirubrobacter ginsenosidimutans]MDA0167430.1 IS30 family transposase [Solirubrobacter ginsenosidimutans]
MAERVQAGATLREVAAEFGVGFSTVWRHVNEAALARRRVDHSPWRLSFGKREEIFAGICRGESDSAIARRVGRHRSTIGREIARCGGRQRYRPSQAERIAGQLARRPKATKLAACPSLLAAVEAGLRLRWSPQQIAARLKLDHPDQEAMRISHETIYRSLYVQSRGELRRELTAQLRSGRSARRSRGRPERRGRIVGMVPIAERPPEVDERRVPGHWEGDLLIGAGGKSAIATLVERQTRYVLLAHLGTARTSAAVVAALEQRITALPAHLIKSLTWDQGSELAAHQRFTEQTGISVYFCDPHSPWQRGSNENTNGLLRQYLPRSTDLAKFNQFDLDHIAAELNGRPRKTLEWATPAERMEVLLR